MCQVEDTAVNKIYASVFFHLLVGKVNIEVVNIIKHVDFIDIMRYRVLISLRESETVFLRKLV